MESALEKIIALTKEMSAAAERGDLDSLQELLERRGRLLEDLRGAGPEVRDAIDGVLREGADVTELLKGARDRIAAELDSVRKIHNAAAAYGAGRPKTGFLRDDLVG